MNAYGSNNAIELARRKSQLLRLRLLPAAKPIITPSITLELCEALFNTQLQHSWE